MIVVWIEPTTSDVKLSLAMYTRMCLYIIHSLGVRRTNYLLLKAAWEMNMSRFTRVHNTSIVSTTCTYLKNMTQCQWSTKIQCGSVLINGVLKQQWDVWEPQIPVQIPMFDPQFLSHCAYCQMNEPYNLQHTTIQMLKSYTFVMAIKSAIVLVLYK